MSTDRSRHCHYTVISITPIYLLLFWLHCVRPTAGQAAANVNNTERKLTLSKLSIITVIGYN